MQKLKYSLKHTERATKCIFVIKSRYARKKGNPCAVCMYRRRAKAGIFFNPFKTYKK